MPYKENIEIINDGTNTNEKRLGAVKDLEYAISEMGIPEDVYLTTAPQS